MEWEIILSSEVIAAIIAAIVSGYISRKELLDSLDTKSGWRRDIFLVAAKTYLSTDDIYLILAALKFKPHKEAM